MVEEQALLPLLITLSLPSSFDFYSEGDPVQVFLQMFFFVFFL